MWIMCHACFGGSVILRGSGGQFGRTIWQPRHSRRYLSAWISMPGHQTRCLRCCLTLVMPWFPSCASWRMYGLSASGIIIRLFRKIMPRLWQSSSFRSAKGAGAADQFPVSRQSLMVCKVGSDSEARGRSWRVMAQGRESTTMGLTQSSTGSLGVLVVTGLRDRKSTAFWIPGW